MIKHFFLLSLIIVLTISTSSGQKLKFKDILPLLEEKSYKHADRKLKEFLADEKNSDHASGNLYMGIIWQDKVGHIDPIKEPSKFEEANATAIQYLKKSASLLNEKEVSKNEEYYPAYNRRDLRTGKYGVKVSDVMQDIEDRIKKLEEAKTDLAEGKEKLEAATIAYAEIQDLFLETRKLAMNELSFSMRAAGMPDKITALNTIKNSQPRVIALLEEAKVSIDKLPKKPFEVGTTMKPIDDFTTDGETKPVFLQGNFELWDFAGWSDRMLSKINTQVKPVIEAAALYDTRLNKELTKIKESVYMEFSAVTKDLEEAPLDQLKKLYKRPYPEKLFSLKVKELPVHYYLNTEINPSALDTADVDYQVWYCDTLLSVVDNYISALQVLTDTKFSYADWAVFLNREFGNKEGYQQYIQEKKDWSMTLKKAWEERNESWIERSRWAIQGENKKPIPMFSATGMEVETVYKNKYLTFDLKRDTITGNYFVLGVELLGGDKKKGFIAYVTNARRVRWVKNFTMGKVVFGGVEIVADGKFIDTEEGMLSFYLYTPSQGITQNVVFGRTDINGNIKWKIPYVAQNKPDSFEYNKQSKETSVYFGDKKDPSTYVFNIDKNGKIIKR